MAEEIKKASVYLSHFQAAELIPDAGERLAFLEAVIRYQLFGEIPDGLPTVAACLMAAIRPVLERDMERKRGARELPAPTAEELQAKREELGSVRAAAVHFGISERAAWGKLSERQGEQGAQDLQDLQHARDLQDHADLQKDRADLHAHDLQINADLQKGEREKRKEKGEKGKEEGEREGAECRKEEGDEAPPPEAAGAGRLAAPSPSPPPERMPPFKPPSVQEVAEWCEERGNGIDAEAFCAFYASKGWMVGKGKMRDWRQAVITWERRGAQEARARASPARAGWTGSRPRLEEAT